MSVSVRPIAVLALLTFALVAGCSDGPPSGDLVVKPGFLTVDGSTAMNTYVAESGYQANPAPAGPPKFCPPTTTCVDPSSNYKFHFMSLPEPSGDGYAIFQVGGTIGERQLTLLAPTTGGMYEANVTKDADNGGDQHEMFDHFELRMGSFTVASASSAAGSQAFTASPDLAAAKVTGSYKGRSLTVEISGLPGDGTHPQFIGRLYLKSATGNLTVGESFPLFNGGTTFESKERNIGDYAEFHVHVTTSKIYVYQAYIGKAPKA